MNKNTIKIAMYDIEGNFLEIIEGNTFTEIEKSLELPKSSLNGCINGLVISSNFKQFRKITSVDNYILKLPSAAYMTRGLSNKPVLKYYKNNFKQSGFPFALILRKRKTGLTKGNKVPCYEPLNAFLPLFCVFIS